MSAAAIPGDITDLRTGVERYYKLDPRDDTYVVARRYVDLSWPDCEAAADAVCVLLRIWNGANRGQGPSTARVAEAIEKYQADLTVFRNLTLHQLTDTEAEEAGAMMDAFRGPSGVFRNDVWNNSSVGAAKLLHIIAPAALPPWDNQIARALGCGDRDAESYGEFVKSCRDFLTQEIGSARDCADEASRMDVKYKQSKTIVRRLDEYLFMRFTRPDGSR